LSAEKIELVATTTSGEVVHSAVVNISFSLPQAAAAALQRDANEACHGALKWLEDNSE